MPSKKSPKCYFHSTPTRIHPIMAQEQDLESPKRFLYPVESSSYRILDEIGVGVSAVVYKALCIPKNSAVVAIKSIDLDRSRVEFENIRREAKTMSLLSHPNILQAYCSFNVDRHLWVVMPFMQGGSLQSIISSAFPEGLSEPCIAVVLKEILNALSYLHNQGHLHRDIKAGNILIDSNGGIKLADFGVSASIYDSVMGHGSASSFSCASRMMFNDVAGTPYWMAPEVIHSHTGYSLKADIWSFGITALELAHGRPPLSHLPPSKSLLMKITKRFRFSDYEKHKKDKNKKFSKAFKDMVASCLDQDPSKRPSADKLLKHSFFKNCKGSDFLVKNILLGLPSVEERFKEAKMVHGLEGAHMEDEDVVVGENVSKTRRISGWNFNEEGFELDPVFPIELKDDSVVKQVRFGGESFIREKRSNDQSSDSIDSGESSMISLAQMIEDLQMSYTEGGSGERRNGENQGFVDKEAVMGRLLMLQKNLDDQRQIVTNLICTLGGEVNIREEDLMESLRMELEDEKVKNFELELELGILKALTSGACKGCNDD